MYVLAGRDKNGTPRIYAVNQPRGAETELRTKARAEGWTDLQWYAGDSRKQLPREPTQ